MTKKEALLVLLRRVEWTVEAIYHGEEEASKLGEVATMVKAIREVIEMETFKEV